MVKIEPFIDTVQGILFVKRRMVDKIIVLLIHRNSFFLQKLHSLKAEITCCLIVFQLVNIKTVVSHKSPFLWFCHTSEKPYNPHTTILHKGYTEIALCYSRPIQPLYGGFRVAQLLSLPTLHLRPSQAQKRFQHILPRS